MHRRHFLQAGLGAGALLLGAGTRAADATRARFDAALARDPSLAVYTGVVGARHGQARVQGRLPAELRGTFYRNGPGRFELGGERYHHWFDGDGFVQSWTIADGRVSHRGRFVETRKYLDESAAGQFLYPTFGTWIDRRGVRDNDTMNAANTNLVPFGGRLYALWEGGSATEVDPATLATRGIKTWRDDLAAMPFSAHPKVGPDGVMWNFGALPGRDKLALYRIGVDGRVLQTNVIDVPQLAMVHDFAVSQRHLVFVIPPYDLKTGANVSLAESHVWAGAGAHARPTRVLVVAKDTLTVRRVFELPPHMVFHLGNAWDEAGGARTHVDMVLHQGDALAAVGHLMEGRRGPNRQAGHAAVRVCLDYAGGGASVSRLLDGAEFPRVMPQTVGQRHRRLALLSSDRRNPALLLDTVNLVDTDSGRADSYRFGPGWQAEEHVLVPRRGARGETDGWLLGVAQDSRAGVSVLTVFDAARVAAGPVAMAPLPYRVPLCFHGNFLAA